MLLRKTGIRMAYWLTVVFMPHVTQFSWILRAACGIGLCATAHLDCFTLNTLKQSSNTK
ncbi:MAG: hypothetical protein JW787_02580 [Sedimentisphaerales bacterium]|nr:hypothetical protein [Sedimentisphaerales bacterium]